MLTRPIVTLLLTLALTLTPTTAYLKDHVETKPIDPDNVPKKFDYTFAVKQPYFMYDEKKIPYFAEHGTVILSAEEIRLTPSVPDSKGSIWTDHPNRHKEWQAVFSFNVFGRGFMGGEGLAFWYTKKPLGLGPMYGSEDKWEGMGIFFDTADQLENRYTPFVFGLTNDGKQEMAHRKDYLTASFAGCFRDYRNTPGPVWARVTYANQTVRLDVDLTQNGKGFNECFTRSGIELPPNYYFGLSAATEAHLADDHDILSFEVYELNPAPKTKQPVRPHEKEHLKKEGEFHLTDDVKKMIERIEQKVDDARKMSEGGTVPEGVQEAITPNVIQKIQETQFHIIEALDLVLRKLDEPGVLHLSSPSSSSSSSSSSPQSRASNEKNDITQKLSTLTEEIRRLNTQQQKTTTAISGIQLGIKSQQQQKLQSQASPMAGQHSFSTSTVAAGGFVAGLVVMWGVSLVRRVVEVKDKKFI